MRRIAHPATVVVASILLAWGAVGCSAGDGGTVAIETWTQQADELCTISRVEADAARPVTGAGSPVPPVRARADLARQQAEALSDLGSPKGASSEAAELVESLEDQANALDQLADALLIDPTASAGPAGAAATVANDRVTDAASELDLPSCSAVAATADSSVPGNAETFDPGVDDGEGGGGFVEE